MKKLLVACLLLVSISAFSQTAKKEAVSYKIENGKVVSVTKTEKQPDKIYATVDGKVFYQGSKGGVYYFATNKKGEKAKRYVAQK